MEAALWLRMSECSAVLAGMLARDEDISKTTSRGVKDLNIVLISVNVFYKYIVGDLDMTTATTTTMTIMIAMMVLIDEGHGTVMDDGWWMVDGGWWMMDDG